MAILVKSGTAKNDKLTHSRLLECVVYDPDTGVFTCKAHQRKSRYYQGDVLGSLISSGYVQIYVDGVSYLAHRLAWFYVHGAMPTEDIDHRDGVKTHNWIGNLRPATRRQNIRNQAMKSSNSSGYKGVYFCNQKKKYAARIRVEGDRIHLGFFATAELAGAAYTKAAVRYHGEFANVG